MQCPPPLDLASQFQNLYRFQVSILILLGRKQGLLDIGAAHLSLVFCKDIIATCSICIARSFECLGPGCCLVGPRPYQTRPWLRHWCLVTLLLACMYYNAGFVPVVASVQRWKCRVETPFFVVIYAGYVIFAH